MTTNGSDHLVGLGTDVPCEVVVTRYPEGTAEAHCLAHRCRENYRVSEAEARRVFVCDLGRLVTFLVHVPDITTAPLMMGLTGLKAEAWSIFDGGPRELPTVWRYMHDGTCQPVHVTCEQVDDYAFEFVATAEDGTVLLSVRSDE